MYVQARLEILKVYTSQKPIIDVNLDDIARQTDGFSGADLENLCNEVALIYAVSTSPVELFIAVCKLPWLLLPCSTVRTVNCLCFITSDTAA